jgi:hypothetical protein
MPANATGDFATVLGALSTLTATQGQAVLTSISGQNYAGFSTAMVQNAQLFMSNFSAQAGGGGSLRGSSRVALPKRAMSRAIRRRPPCGAPGVARSAAWARSATA